jgi:hypothetical protein
MSNDLFSILYALIMNSLRNSLIIVSDYRLDDRYSMPGRGKGFFLYHLCPDQLRGPPSLLSIWYWGSFVVGKARPGLEADQSLPYSAKVKNEKDLYFLSPLVPAWR